MILCLETSTDICSVSICDTDGQLLAIKETERNFSHSEVITLFIEDVLAEAGKRLEECCAVALSSGPGSYTALRVGASVAKGLCYGLDIPFISLPSLLAMADSLYDTLDESEVIFSVKDARRKEVYCEVYNSAIELMESTSARILDEDSLAYLDAFKTIHIVGDASVKVGEIAHKAENLLVHEAPPSSIHMHRLAVERYGMAQFDEIITFEPNYFKKPNITKSKKKLL